MVLLFWQPPGPPLLWSSHSSVPQHFAKPRQTCPELAPVAPCSKLTIKESSQRLTEPKSTLSMRPSSNKKSSKVLFEHKGKSWHLQSHSIEAILVHHGTKSKPFVALCPKVNNVTLLNSFYILFILPRFLTSKLLTLALRTTASRTPLYTKTYVTPRLSYVLAPDLVHLAQSNKG